MAIPQPDLRTLLSPLLAALPYASTTRDPPPALLDSLSPILRQRVNALSESSYLPHLSYTASNLSDVINKHVAAYEPHPVSGEIELDWEDARVIFSRRDVETLEAVISLSELGLFIKLVWCGAEQWRISAVEAGAFTDRAGYFDSLSEAEEVFAKGSRSGERSTAMETPSALKPPLGSNSTQDDDNDNDDDDDDDYWLSYDRTPAARSPGPFGGVQQQDRNVRRMDDEDEYYSQYTRVQPAMDGHDPDEEVLPEPEILRPDRSSFVVEEPGATKADSTYQSTNNRPFITHAPIPRRPSNGSSADEETSPVARLEETFARDGHVERHIQSSIKSLFFLARGGGMPRAQFVEAVTRELKCLEMYDDDEGG